MARLIKLIGVGQWLRIVASLISVVLAVGLLVPALAPLAALLRVRAMLVAIAPIFLSLTAPLRWQLYSGRSPHSCLGTPCRKLLVVILMIRVARA